MLSQFQAQLLSEALGTFVFLLAIFVTGKPVPIAIGLLVALYLFSSISGAHFNTTITLVKWLEGDVSGYQAIGYVISQFVGGLAAYYVYTLLLKKHNKFGSTYSLKNEGENKNAA